MDDLLEEYQRLIEQAPADPTERCVELALQILEPERACYFKLCAIPHQFNPRILQVLSVGMSERQAKELCSAFAGLSLVTPTAEDLIIHEASRRYLFEQWLQPQNADEFRAASARLVRYFDGSSTDAPPHQLAMLQRSRMFHLIGADQPQGIVEFERLFSQRRDEMRLSDCEDLVGLVHEYDRVLTAESAARLAYQEGKLAASRRHWSRAEELFSSVLAGNGLPEELAVKGYQRLGMVHAEQQDWEGAIQLYRQALERAQTRPECSELVPRILHELGVAYRDSGELSRATELLNDAIELGTKLGKLVPLAVYYNSIATVYDRRGDLEQAIAAYERSLEYLERAHDRFRAGQVYNNLGAAYVDKRDWARSEEFFRKSLEIERQAGDTLAQAKALNNLVRVYANSNRRQEAEETARQAIAMFTEMHDLYNVARAKRNLGRLYRSMKNWDLARQLLTEAADEFERCKMSEETSATRRELQTLTRKIGLPWWAWLAIVLFVLLMIVIVIGLLVDAQESQRTTRSEKPPLMDSAVVATGPAPTPPSGGGG